MIFWMLRRKRWPYAVVALFLIADFTIGPALLAWEIKMLRPYLNP